MDMDYWKLAKNILFLLAVSLLIYFNISRWKSGLLGLVLLLLYLIYAAAGARAALAKFFNLSHKAFRIRALGMFLGLVTLSWLSVPLIIFSRLTSFGIAAVFFINGIFYFFLERWTERSKKTECEVQGQEMVVLEEVPQAKVAVFAYLALALYGFYLLAGSRTGAAISSPWQTIDPKFIYVFFFTTLILGFLIFSKLKAKAILFLLIMHSFLLHAYLPLTQQYLYGADGWRHVAVESRIIAEKPIDLVLYDQDSFLSKLDPGKFSYGQLWGLSAISARLFNIPLLSINKWLIPVIWSVILPILLFEIAGALGFAKKESLLFAWFGFLPFALQAAGSFTLPVNFGFLIWLLSCLLILKRLKSPRREQIVLLILFGAGLILSYFLYFILFCVALLAAEISKTRRLGKMNSAVLIIFGILAIPVIELIAGYSRFSLKIGWLAQIKQFAGNFTSYYLASGPRPHDIDFGNIIFNQVPLYAFVANFFTDWLWWILVPALGFICLAALGFRKLIRENEVKFKWIAVMSASVLGAYILSVYFLSGDHILARRLDSVIAFFLLILIFFAWIKFVFNRVPQKIGIPLTIILFAIAITASYSLGPDTQSVSADQYAAANYVWQQEKNSAKHCVLGDTYPLLALEAVSSKEIVGGGFPINQYFAQQERVDLLSEMKQGLVITMPQSAFNLTGSNRCWFITDAQTFKKLGANNNYGYALFGNSVVIRYNLK